MFSSRPRLTQKSSSTAATAAVAAGKTSGSRPLGEANDSEFYFLVRALAEPPSVFFLLPAPPFAHSRALFLCRISVLVRPSFTPIKPPHTKAITAVSIHSIVSIGAPRNVEFDSDAALTRSTVSGLMRE